ncbi:Hypothetical protein CINCED_3A006605 [Cinara cedri]|uniref:Uncharacterized protein n=1 Tax=Cinara cedri TaxID=506608 RepID=A0A5E4MAY5_9HEMI|nr:Hypothetical protein CINCED_3A006605 [Cinara cedri]
MSLNITQYNYNTQPPPNNQTNSNKLSSNYCNAHCNSPHNSFTYDNGNNSSLNYNRNQNDSSFVNPLSGYPNLTIYPTPKPSSNNTVSNATSSSSSVMNTATLDQNVCNHNYNYNPNQMSTGSYHPHAETAQKKSGLPADYSDKVSPGLPDGQIQNTPNQANSVTVYAQK